MKRLAVSLCAVAALSAAPTSQTFTGVVSDDMCGADGHVSMRMGPTDAECARACVETHGAEYVIAVGKDAFVLSDQQAAERFAARRVRVVGTLDAKTKTIHVESITAAK